MKTLILLAGAAMLATTGPALAKPGHAKHGKKGQHSRSVDYRHFGYGQGACPPGLAKKNPQCMPPGQYKKRFQVGQRLPYGYDSYTPYNQIPYDLRRQYDLSNDYRYIYQDDYLYRVDPTTLIVQQVLQALLR
jgi:hypothetical protein